MKKLPIILILVIFMLPIVLAVGINNPNIPGIIDQWLPKTGGRMIGDIDMNNNTIFNSLFVNSTFMNWTLIDFTAITNPVWVNKTGDTMTGDLNVTGTSYLDGAEISDGVITAINITATDVLEGKGTIIGGQTYDVMKAAGFTINPLTFVSYTGSVPVAFHKYTINADGPQQYFIKGRVNATITDETGFVGDNLRPVEEDDALGGFIFGGIDLANRSGTSNAAGIRAYVDGTVVNGKVPGRLEFETADETTGTLTDRMIIGESGRIGVGTDPSYYPSSRLTMRTEIGDGTFENGLLIQNPSTTIGTATGIIFRVYGGTTLNKANMGIVAESTATNGRGILHFLMDDYDGSNVMDIAGESVMRLDYNGNLEIDGNLDVTKNITGNQIYGEMWWHNETGITLTFGVANTWYPIFFDEAEELNGFSFIGGIEESSNLTSQVAGLYDVTHRMTGSGDNNHIYTSTILVNGLDYSHKCHDHKKLSAGGDETPMGSSCYVRLAVGDTITTGVRDRDSTSSGNYYSGMLNLERIGD